MRKQRSLCLAAAYSAEPAVQYTLWYVTTGKVTRKV